MRSKKRNTDNQLLMIPGLKTPKEVFRSTRNYLAGQFVGATRDDALLDEVLKCLFCKLAIENGSSQPIDLEADIFTTAKEVRSLFSKIRMEFPEIFESDAEILLDPETLRFVFRELNFSIMDAASDPIGDAFEVFVGSESRGNAGQFFTPRTVTSLLVTAVDPKPGEKVLDPACGAGGFLSSVCTHYTNSGVSVKELPQIVSRDFFGIDKDSYLARLAKAHIALLSSGHPNIVCGDSLSMQNGTKDVREVLPRDGVDVLLTNPPFGARIIAARPDVLRTFELGRKWFLDDKSGTLAPSNELQSNVPPQVLFVERCLSLLKPGGRLGMVLPESVLSNKSYHHVVQYLTNNCDVHAVMGMPESLFKTSGKGGTHTKTCLVVATKNGLRRKGPSIFMAEAKWCGQDSRARKIPNNDLPEISKNLKAFQENRKFPNTNLGFLVKKSRIKGNVLCPRYYDPEPELEMERLKKDYNLVPFGELVRRNVLSVSTGDEIGKLAYGTGTIPFIRTSDISNWELKSDPKHGVSREIYDSLCVKQDVQAEDILMVKDGTYLIGTCAIVTEAEKEILYQSHLYKIRVNKNDIGLNPYLLLAILSSPIVQKQIRSKQFTQDVIDSLGERIAELVLPIPRDDKMRRRVTDLVRESVDSRIEARKLVSQARTMLFS
jgi:type I restriction enzyme M protein